MYQRMIRERLENMGCVNYDPRHIEAYMRLENSTLDGLSSTHFNREIKVSIKCIQMEGIEMAESLAVSFGL